MGSTTVILMLPIFFSIMITDLMFQKLRFLIYNELKKENFSDFDGK